MPQRTTVDKLLRLTLVQKSGGKLAKHPNLRDGVVEAIKAMDNGQAAAEEKQEVGQEEGGGPGEEADWYAAFEAFILTVPEDAIPSFEDEDHGWEAAFDAHVEKAGKRNNYPSSQGPFAGPHHSFPINSQQRVYSAAKLIGHAQNPAQVKANVIRIARSRGYSLPKSWQSKKVSKSMDQNELYVLIGTLGKKLSKARKSLAPQPSADGVTPTEAPVEVAKAKKVKKLAALVESQAAEIASLKAAIAKPAEPVKSEEAKKAEEDAAKAAAEKAAEEKAAEEAAGTSAAEVARQAAEAAARTPLTAPPPANPNETPRLKIDKNTPFNDAYAYLIRAPQS